MFAKCRRKQMVVRQKDAAQRNCALTVSASYCVISPFTPHVNRCLPFG
jgi:hypothetical protein